MLFGITPIKTIATYGATAERLRQEITLGLIAPNTKLMAERKFAEELGVARITLREALKMLEAEGYLEIRRGASGGAIIAPESKLKLLAQEHLSKSHALCFRALEYWRINQIACARLAAARRTPADLKRLQTTLATLQSFTAEHERRQGESELFLSVAAAASNAWLMASVHDSLAASFLPFIDPPSHEELLPTETIQDLITAIKNNDHGTAEIKMTLISTIYADRYKSALTTRKTEVA